MVNYIVSLGCSIAGKPPFPSTPPDREPYPVNPPPSKLPIGIVPTASVMGVGVCVLPGNAKVTGYKPK